MGAFHHHTDNVNSVAWLSDSMLMSGSDDRTLKLWDLRCPAAAGTGRVDHCFSSDRCGKMVLQFNDAHNGPVTDVSFHPGGQHVVSTSLDSVIKVSPPLPPAHRPALSPQVWDLRGADLYYKLTAHEGASTAVAFNTEGNFFATGGTDEQVILWKTNWDRAEKPVPPPAAPGEARLTVTVVCGVLGAS
jgi:centriolar protein POC1